MVKNLYKNLSTKFCNKKMLNCYHKKVVNELLIYLKINLKRMLISSTVNNSVKQVLTTLLTLFSLIINKL
jgi:hypothetical protein